MTPNTIEVRAFPSTERMNEAMQNQLNEIYERILAGASVAASGAAYEAGQERVARMKRAQASLTARAKRVFEDLKQAATCVRTNLVEAHAEGRESADISVTLQSIATLEQEHKAVTRANSHILEHLLPQADIQELGLAADYCKAKAQALREVAQERIQNTAKLMADAAAYEGEIAFDPLKTLSGELQIQASELERKAEEYLRWQSDRERDYARLCRELEAMNPLRP